VADRHQRVVVVAVLVEPVTPEVPPIELPVPVVPLPEAPVVLLEVSLPVVPPVPDAPIELVPPVVPPVVPLAPAAVSVLLPVVPPVVPAVLPVEPGMPDVPDVPAVLDGLVVVLDEVAELPAPAPASSFLPQALRDRAPTMASAAAAVWVRDIFIRVTP
jgi:hypothetical protein